MRRAVLAFPALALFAAAAAAQPMHGLSSFGDLKYPADFKHFDYADPSASKGGKLITMGTAALSTFDSFNGYILKGDPAQGLNLLFDSLMVRAFDEPDAVYGLLAKTADVAADRMSVTFELRQEAKFADGTPLTAADVCDTFRLFKTYADERIKITIRDINACDVLGPHQVKYSFTGSNARDLPLEIAVLPVFSKAYYGIVDFSKTTLDPPLGSGPYKIGSHKQGQFVTYLRRDDYWAKDLPVNAGRYNFDVFTYQYYRDRVASVEALKAGEIDLREEFSSKSWANDYEGLKSIAEGRLIKEVLPDDTPSGAQGWFLNMRRPQFQDVRVRQAFGMAFDFEWSNANLFYGLYKRSASVFENSPLKAEGPPSPQELELLEPSRNGLSPEVFGLALLPPVTDGSGQDRKILRAASRLLDEAGWKVSGTNRINAKGDILKAEFLIDDGGFERIISPYVRNLKLLGVDATLRIIDEAQYQRRQEEFDYDIVSARFVLSQTPGVELVGFFGSKSADPVGTYNLAAIKNPAIDTLIEKVIQAPSREHLIVAARALDRALRAEYFWVPNWHKGEYWIAYWDQFGRPAVKPKYDRGIIDLWWYDAAKAAKLKRGN